jgi:hypothetical protein
VIIQFDDFWKDFCEGGEIDIQSEDAIVLRRLASCAWDAALLSIMAHSDSMVVNKHIVPAIFDSPQN